jgi:hypothetical protein
MVQAYCVKCKAKKEIKVPKAIKMKNGKPDIGMYDEPGNEEE